MFVATLVAVLCQWLVWIAAAHAASVPVGFVDEQIAGGLTSPTALTVLPDGRVLAVQQNGVIRIAKNDVLLNSAFWVVPNVDSSSERGCLGITPDPNFASNAYVYVYCTITDGTTSNNRILRASVVGDAIVPNSQTTIFALGTVTSTYHMGGALRFGPDGLLYVAVGDHEDVSPSADKANSQNLSNPYGKLLRITADGSVPSDNPFVAQPGAFAAIWSYGYRNPFSFDIQPSTGRMFVGDVGQDAWEEIDDSQRGANYGWPVFEGPHGDSHYAAPFYAYDHNAGGCSITGGVFYEPLSVQFPTSFTGKYLFGDFCKGTIEVLDPSTARVAPFVSGISHPTNLALAADGSVYYVARNQETGNPLPGLGTLGRIGYTGSGVPRITQQPLSQTVLPGAAVSFSVSADDAQRYQWQADGLDIPGATSSSYTLASSALSDDRQHFRSVVSNASGSVTSTEAVLTVTTNRPPSATIVTPSDNMQYAPGDTIRLTGQASDREDGPLPDAAFTWQVDFQHDVHTHPLVPATTGQSSLAFTVPDFEATEANTWLRVYLTVRDSGGATQTVFRNIFPKQQLSSLEPTLSSNGWGGFERDLSNGEIPAGDGHVISLSGIPYLHGLGVHAPSELSFALRGNCLGNFVADVGIDDEVGAAGSVVFQVFADGVAVFDSGAMHGGDPRRAVDVSMVDVQTLRLVVGDAGDGIDYDHADWGSAHVTYCMLLK
jgi:glucose/arabinose dehydrogenase